MYFGTSALSESTVKDIVTDAEPQISRIYEHMLKYEVQTNRQSKSWLQSMYDGRLEALTSIKNNKEAMKRLRDQDEKLYREGQRKAIKALSKGGIDPKDVVPADKSIYNIDIVLSKGFIENFTLSNINDRCPSINRDMINDTSINYQVPDQYYMK